MTTTTTGERCLAELRTGGLRCAKMAGHDGGHLYDALDQANSKHADEMRDE